MPRSTHLYVWVASRHYFLVSFVDAFSRYIVHHRLLTELSGTAVSVELEAALASCTGAKPRIVHDHGSEFDVPPKIYSSQKESPPKLKKC